MVGEFPDPAGAALSLDEVVRRHIRHVLRLTNNHVTETARILKIDRRTLQRHMRRWPKDG